MPQGSLLWLLCVLASNTCTKTIRRCSLLPVKSSLLCPKRCGGGGLFQLCFRRGVMHIQDEVSGSSQGQIYINKRKSPFTLTSHFRTILEFPDHLPTQIMSLGCRRKPEHPERSHTGTGKTCRVHAGKPRVQIFKHLLETFPWCATVGSGLPGERRVSILHSSLVKCCIPLRSY